MSKKILIAWGMKDIGFRKKELNKWIATFPNAKVVCYSDAGHFVSEEKSTDLVGKIRQMFS
jgi:pimeloyl-ACP methyl ester carboxylesterase